MPDVNPITQAYRAIWTTLEASSDFTDDLVRAGNRIKYVEGQRDPDKDGALTTDYPEVVVTPGPARIQYGRTSSGTSLEQNFRIWISTGQQQTLVMFNVQWAIIRAMADWETHMKDLTWNEKKFIKHCEMNTDVKTLDDHERNRLTRGWVLAWSGMLDMWFDTSDLPPD